MEQEIEVKKKIQTKFQIDNLTIPIEYDDTKYSKLIGVRTQQLQQKINDTQNLAVLQRLKEIHTKYGVDVTASYIEKKGFKLYYPYLYMIQIYGKQDRYYQALMMVNDLKRVQGYEKEEEIPEQLLEMEQRIKNILQKCHEDFKDFCQSGNIPFKDSDPELGYGYVEQRSLDNLKQQIDKHQLYIQKLKEKLDLVQEEGQEKSPEVVSQEKELKKNYNLNSLLEIIYKKWEQGFRCGKNYQKYINENKINFDRLI